MGKNQKQVLGILTDLITADVKQISAKSNDLWEDNVRTALRNLKNSGHIKIVAHRPMNKFHRIPLNVYKIV